MFRGRRYKISVIKPSGGARRDRTDDLMLAKHALSQLSYGPVTRRRMLRSARLRSSSYGAAAFAFTWLAQPKLA